MQKFTKTVMTLYRCTVKFKNLWCDNIFGPIKSTKSLKYDESFPNTNEKPQFFRAT